MVGATCSHGFRLLALLIVPWADSFFLGRPRSLHCSAPLDAPTALFHQSSSRTLLSLVRNLDDETFMIYPTQHDNKRRNFQQATTVQAIRRASTIRQVMDAIPSSRLNLAEAAAAVRQLASLSKNGTVPALLPKLLAAIEQRLQADEAEDDDFVPEYSQYALSDVFVALALCHSRLLGDVRNDRFDTYSLLANRLWSLLMDNYDAPLPSPKRLAECLSASNVLRLPIPTPQSSMTLDRMYCRLAQGDAIGQLSPGMASRLLQLCVRRLGNVQTQPPSLLILSQVLARRLRQQSMRRNVPTKQLMVLVKEATETVVLSNQPLSVHDDEAHEQLAKELRTMVYTLMRHELLKRTDLGPSDCSSLLELAMRLNLDWEDAVVQHFVDQMKNMIVGHAPFNLIDNDNNLEFAAIYLQALAHWRQSSNTSDIALALGERLENAVRETKVAEPQWTRHVNSLLRSAVLLHRDDATVMAPYISAVRLLILDTDVFLQTCQSRELANLAWFILRARVVGDEWNAAVITLAQRVLEPEVVATGSPKLASRIISAFTDLFALHEADKRPHDRGPTSDTKVILSRLFEAYGSYLLSTAVLSPADLSSSIYAFAKASYTFDQGVFDCLVDEFKQRLHEDATVRQTAQCLWACAKMMAWEDDASVDQYASPPYSLHALALCHFLVQESNLLSKQDVSQALWSLARLGIVETSLVDPLATRAKDLAAQLSMQEIANILWALTKLDARRFDVVFAITRALTTNKLNDHQRPQPSPQECSVILHSLACMDIRDESIYQSLTQCMLSQMDETSAQAVASVLRAHEAVHISPPQALLDKFAREKLGISPALGQGKMRMDGWYEPM